MSQTRLSLEELMNGKKKNSQNSDFIRKRNSIHNTNPISLPSYSSDKNLSYYDQKSYNDMMESSPSYHHSIDSEIGLNSSSRHHRITTHHPYDEIRSHEIHSTRRDSEEDPIVLSPLRGQSPLFHHSRHDKDTELSPSASVGRFEPYETQIHGYTAHDPSIIETPRVSHIPTSFLNSSSSNLPLGIQQNENWTSEQITKVQIDRLQRACDDANEEISRQRAIIAAYEQDMMRYNKELSIARLRERIQAVQIAVSERASLEPNNPFALLRTVRYVLPRVAIDATRTNEKSTQFYSSFHKTSRSLSSPPTNSPSPFVNTQRLALACLVKSGSAWVCLSSESRASEEMVFRSRGLDAFLRSRLYGDIGVSLHGSPAGAMNEPLMGRDTVGVSLYETILPTVSLDEVTSPTTQSGGANVVHVDDLNSVLPPLVAAYVLSGDLPEVSSTRKVYSAESVVMGMPTVSHRRSNSSSLTSEGVFIRCDLDGNTRCVFILTPSMDDESTIGEGDEGNIDDLSHAAETLSRVVLEGEEMSPSLSEFAFTMQTAFMEESLNGSSGVSVNTVWRPSVFTHLTQLFAAATVALFESRRNDTSRLVKQVKDAVLDTTESSSGAVSGWSLTEEVLGNLILRELENADLSVRRPKMFQPKCQFTCQFLLSSQHAHQNDTLLVMNLKQKVFTRSAWGTEEERRKGYMSFEDARNDAFWSALQSRTPQVRTYSVASSVASSYSGVKSRGDSNSGTDGLAFQYSDASYSNSVCVVIPLTTSQSTGQPFCCLSFEVQCSTNLASVASFVGKFAAQETPLHLSLASIVHQPSLEAIVSSFTADVGDILINYQKVNNFTEFSLFLSSQHSRSPLAFSSVSESSIVSLLRKMYYPDGKELSSLTPNLENWQIAQNLAGVLESDWFVTLHIPDTSLNAIDPVKTVHWLTNWGETNYGDLQLSCGDFLSSHALALARAVTTRFSLEDALSGGEVTEAIRCAVLPSVTGNNPNDGILKVAYSELNMTHLAALLRVQKLGNEVVGSGSGGLLSICPSSLSSVLAVTGLSTESFCPSHSGMAIAIRAPFETDAIASGCLVLYVGRCWRGEFDSVVDKTGATLPVNGLYRWLSWLRLVSATGDSAKLRRDYAASCEVLAVAEAINEHTNVWFDKLTSIEKRVESVLRNEQSFISSGDKPNLTWLRHSFLSFLSKYIENVLRVSYPDSVSSVVSVWLSVTCDEGGTWELRLEDGEMNWKPIDESKNPLFSSVWFSADLTDEDLQFDVWVGPTSNSDLSLWSGSDTVISLLKKIAKTHLLSEKVSRFITHTDLLLLNGCEGNVEIFTFSEAHMQDTTSRLSLAALSDAMLKTGNHTSIGASHLSSYIRSGSLLTSLAKENPFRDFFLLPIAPWNPTFGSLALDDLPSDSDGDDYHTNTGKTDSGEGVFVHLLSQCEEFLSTAEFEELKCSSITLPSRISQRLSIALRTSEMDNSNVDGSSKLPSWAEKFLTRVSPHSALTAMPSISRTLRRYLVELDEQLEGQLASSFMISSGSPLNSHKSGSLFRSLLSRKGRVVLYHPSEQNLSVTSEWVTHFICVARCDRLVTNYSIRRIGAWLDGVYSPLRVLSAGATWFSSVAGLERLALTAAAASTSHQSLTGIDSNGELLSEAVSAVASGGTSRLHSKGGALLRECVSALRAAVGNRYVASAAYLREPSVEDNKESTGRVSLSRIYTHSAEGGVASDSVAPLHLWLPSTTATLGTAFVDETRIPVELSNFTSNLQCRHTQWRHRSDITSMPSSQITEKDLRAGIHYSTLNGTTWEKSLHLAATAAGEVAPPVSGALLRRDASAVQLILTAGGGSSGIAEYVVAVVVLFVRDLPSSASNTTTDSKKSTVSLSVRTTGSLRSIRHGERASRRLTSLEDNSPSRQQNGSSLSNSSSVTWTKAIVELANDIGGDATTAAVAIPLLDVAAAMLSSLYLQSRDEVLLSTAVSGELAVLRAERDVLRTALTQLTDALAKHDFLGEASGLVEEAEKQTSSVLDAANSTEHTSVHSPTDSLFAPPEGSLTEQTSAISLLSPMHLTLPEAAQEALQRHLTQVCGLLKACDRLRNSHLNLQGLLRTARENCSIAESAIDSLFVWFVEMLKQFGMTVEPPQSSDPETVSAWRLVICLQVSALFAVGSESLALLTATGREADIWRMATMLASCITSDSFSTRFHPLLSPLSSVPSSNSDVLPLAKEVEGKILPTVSDLFSAVHATEAALDAKKYDFRVVLVILTEVITPLTRNGDALSDSPWKEAMNSANIQDAHESLRFPRDGVLLPNSLTQSVLSGHLVEVSGSELRYAASSATDVYTTCLSAADRSVARVAYLPLSVNSSSHGLVSGEKAIAVIQVIEFESIKSTSTTVRSPVDLSHPVPIVSPAIFTLLTALISHGSASGSQQIDHREDTISSAGGALWQSIKRLTTLDNDWDMEKSPLANSSINESLPLELPSWLSQNYVSTLSDAMKRSLRCPTTLALILSDSQTFSVSQLSNLVQTTAQLSKPPSSRAILRLHLALRSMDIRNGEVLAIPIDDPLLLPSSATSAAPAWLLLAVCPVTPGSGVKLDSSHGEWNVISTYDLPSHNDQTPFVLLIAESCHTPTQAEQSAMEALLSLHRLRDTLECRQNLLTSASSALELTKQTLESTQVALFDKHSRSTLLIDIWRLMQTISPSFYASHHHDVSSQLRLLRSRGADALQAFSDWLADGKELSCLVGTEMTAALLPLSPIEMDSLPALSLPSTLSDINSTKEDVYEARYEANGSHSEKFFLPVYPVSQLMNERVAQSTLKHFVDISGLSNSESQEVYIERLLAAVAISTQAVVVDDVFGTLTLAVPLSCQAGASNEPLLYSTHANSSSQSISDSDLALLTTLSLPVGVAGANTASNDDEAAVASCSNWALVLRFQSATEVATLLRTLRGETSSMEEVPDSDYPSLLSPAIVEKETERRRYEWANPILGALSLTLRQWLRWNRTALMKSLLSTQSRAENALTNTLLAVSDSAQAFQGLLHRALNTFSLTDDPLSSLPTMLTLAQSFIATILTNVTTEKVSVSNIRIHIRQTSLPSYEPSNTLNSPMSRSELFTSPRKNTNESSPNENEWIMATLHAVPAGEGLSAEEASQSWRQSGLFADFESRLLGVVLSSNSILVPSSLTEGDRMATFSDEQNVCLTLPSENGPLSSARLLLGGNLTDSAFVLEIGLDLRTETYSTTNSSVTYDWLLFLPLAGDRLRTFLADNTPALESARHSVAHVLTLHNLLCKAKERHRIDDTKIAYADSRESVLRQILSLLTSEGSNAVPLINGFQAALASLPGVHASTLTVRDTNTANVLHDATVTYDTQVEPLTLDLLSPQSQYSVARGSFTVGALSSSVAGGVLSPFSPQLKRANGGFPASPSTPTISLSSRRVLNVSPIKTSDPKSPTPRSENRSVPSDVIPGSLEITFQCHEISGTIVISFAQHAIANSLGANTKSSPVDLMWISHHHLAVHQANEILLSDLTAALGRRVFELIRGQRNKRIMAEKKAALLATSQQLAEKTELVKGLEATQSMTETELREVVHESERLRLVALSEQKALREALTQKKEQVSQFRQNLLEQRRESEKKENLLNRQLKDARDRLNSLEAEREKDRKALIRLQTMEQTSSSSRKEMVKQLADAQKANQDAESSIRKLRTELTALQAREAATAEGTDAKLNGLLQRIRLLEEELSQARTTSSFLKKQLEASSQNLRRAQEDHGRQLSSLQNAINIDSPRLQSPR